MRAFRSAGVSLSNSRTTSSRVLPGPALGTGGGYRWRERKGLPAHKIGRLWKFQLSEVDEWVRAGGADEGAAAGSEQHNEND